MSQSIRIFFIQDGSSEAQRVHPHNGLGAGLATQSPASKSSGQSLKMPKINLGLSREDRELMKKKLENLKDNPKPGVSYNNYSPRAQRDRSKYDEPSGSASEEEEEEENKKKSKFFKHTEKERDNERKKRRDERKKFKDEDFVPEEDSSDRKRKHEDDDDENNWLKRRRKHERSPVPDLDNYVPKTTSRKIERKLAPKIQKIDSETLMESSNYQKFNRTLETIFDNSEEVNYCRSNLLK